MSVELTINNNSYNYPENGENPGWGEDATAWAQAVTEVLGTLQGSNDIPLSSANISDSVTNESVLGLSFNPVQVLQFRIEYTVKRVYDDGNLVKMETGVLYGYNDDSTIFISQESHGDAGIDFDISGGQIIYTSSTLADYQSGVITFKATTMNK
jgi:hypothetical protein